MTTCRRLCLAAALVLLAAPVVAQPIRLFIVAPTSDFVDAASSAKMDSTQDLAQYFKTADDPKANREKIVVTVNRDDADLVLEISERGYVATGNFTRPALQGVGPLGSRVAEAESFPRIVATLTIGDYVTTISGGSIRPFGAWKDAASSLRSELERFVKENRMKLMARR